MAERDLMDWERLFGRALRALDAAQAATSSHIVWTLGGGSVLMRRYRHRRSPGVDIFLRDERMLRGVAAALQEAIGNVDRVEDATTLRICLPEGQVAFIAHGLTTLHPVRRELIRGRSILVESSAEILARKLWFRAASLPARDLFDFAAVAAFEPEALRELGGVLRVRRGALMEHLRLSSAALREDFAALHAWEFNPGFEECLAAVGAALSRCSPPPVLDQPMSEYGVPSSGVALQRKLRNQTSQVSST